jgi:tetratricopeptide (TPR) repeat protein
VLLWHGKLGDARQWYQRAETFNANFIPAQVRAARIGAFPNSIREFITSGNHGAALDIVARWEETFPTEKLKGQTFFWRGKLQALRGQHEDAARYLARAIGLAVGASFESEARWLLALSLEELGRPDDARRELARLVAIGSNDSFTELAKKKLK